MMTYSMQPQMSAFSHHYSTTQSPYYSRPTPSHSSASRSPSTMDAHYPHYPADRRSHTSSHSRSLSSESNASEQQRTKPFLPSISNLLIIADGERDRDVAPPPKSQFQLQDGFQERSRHHYSPSRSTPLDHRAIPSHPAVTASHERTAVSTSPQLHSISSRSGSNASSPLVPATRGYLSISALNNTDPHDQRPSSHLPSLTTASQPIKQHSQEAHQQQTPSYTTSPAATTSSYAYSPSTASSHSPAPSTRSTAGTAPPSQQQHFDGPLPAEQQALAQATALREAAAAAAESGASNPWQHHHYINASSAAGFPSSSQDRYICPKCLKAFSRPSSLKIHSHSHTGEKPFLCPYPGCGKSFSVRSNMRRHERGCHSGAAGGGPASPRVGRD